MAKILIAGNAAVITSAVKLDDIKTIAKYRPEALVLKGGEDGKEPIFAISVAGRGVGEIGQYGAVFSAETHNEDKLATITIGLADIGEADIKEFVADKLGGALTKLNKLEATLPEVITDIEAEKATVLGNISVAQ